MHNYLCTVEITTQKLCSMLGNFRGGQRETEITVFRWRGRSITFYKVVLLMNWKCCLCIYWCLPSFKNICVCPSERSFQCKHFLVFNMLEGELNEQSRFGPSSMLIKCENKEGTIVKILPHLLSIISPCELEIAKEANIWGPLAAKAGPWPTGPVLKGHADFQGYTVLSGALPDAKESLLAAVSWAAPPIHSKRRSSLEKSMQQAESTKWIQIQENEETLKT